MMESITRSDVEWTRLDHIKCSAVDRLEQRPKARNDWDLNVEHNVNYTCGGYWLEMWYESLDVVKSLLLSSIFYNKTIKGSLQ